MRETLELSADGYLVFDDTVLDKRHSYKIETVYQQYSGNERKVIKGIGVITCVYVNPKIGQFWAMNYRIYNQIQMAKTSWTT